MTVDFHSKMDNVCWRCTSVYGPNARNLKPSFWEELRNYDNRLDIPWVIYGDFNAIFSMEDKASSYPNLEDICSANALFQDLGLLGATFSWP